MGNSNRDDLNLNILDKIIRTTSISTKKITYRNQHNNVVYNPVLERGNIVQCEFTGIGKELDDTHYAIVWSAPNDNENLNVIPLTSKAKDESISIFGIGKISNFITLSSDGNYVNKDTYVYANKMMEVSRRRIKQFFQKDIHGKTVQALKKGKTINLPVIASAEQLKRISESIQLFYLNEGDTLIDIINNQHVSYFCDIYDKTNIFDIGYRLLESYRIYDINDNKVIIFFVAGTRYSLILKKMSDENWDIYKSQEHLKLYKNIKISNSIVDRRKNILCALFSRNQDKFDEAVNIIQDIFKNS